MPLRRCITHFCRDIKHKEEKEEDEAGEGIGRKRKDLVDYYYRKGLQFSLTQ